jgi:hypothetical protein
VQAVKANTEMPANAIALRKAFLFNAISELSVRWMRRTAVGNFLGARAPNSTIQPEAFLVKRLIL